MGNPYTTQTISNYNTSPPADDGSAVASNQLSWAKHKDKLADPIKTLSEAINTEVLAAFGKLHLNNIRAISANDSMVAADERKLISCTNSITYTLLAAATAGDGFTVAVLNAGTGTITIEADSSELIDGELNKTLENQYNVIFLRCDGSGWNVISVNFVKAITLGTAQATTSGTAKTFGSLPTGLNRITVMFDQVSTDGTSDLIIRIGDSGGIETTGYSSGASDDNSTGFAVNTGMGASDQNSGSVTLTRIDTSHTWVASGVVYNGQTDVSIAVNQCAGVKQLSAELTQVQVTSVSADTFDNGQVNIAYE